ncbi:3-hydroxyacyl-CoA dehydrogenase [Muricoccus radiodurans]|uniref:3-hydroxyacyl-CoA dehydrogenase n=1 Tax=Muricoccus radiodurans TaxID=2231721 RepID=UPI003CE83948
MESVAIVGTGLVGRAWAMVFARAGWAVRLWDPVPGASDHALALCRTGLEDLAARGLCGDAPAARARISVHTTLEEALEGVALVQESGPERLEVKVALFRDLDRIAAPGIPLASSTSALRCSLWSEELPGRARCLVGHPVNPPHLVPLVELSGAPWTDPAVVARCHAIYAAIGQSPITLRREVDGFVLNRLQAALLAEAFRLVSEGTVSPADLDLTLTRGLGLRWAFMGPFETIELNAPGGIPDYVSRFRGFLELIPRDPARPEVFGDDAVARIMAEWTPAPETEAKMRWRDRRLAALRVHLDTPPE